MYLPEFAYHRPSSLDQALELKDRHEESVWYAGGTELLALMKMGLSQPSALVDLKGITALRTLQVAPQAITIGAAVTHRAIERDPRIAQTLPVLARTAHAIGNVRVRSVGSLGGNLSFAEPHSDPAPLLMALEAFLTLESTRGSRNVALADFVIGPFETTLEDDEVITTITIPRPDRVRRAVQGRRAFRERATVSAVVIDTTEGYRVGIGAAGPIPVRSSRAEARLATCLGDDEALLDAAHEIGEAAAEDSGAYDEPGASREYKQQLVSVLVRRSVQELAGSPAS